MRRESYLASVPEKPMMSTDNHSVEHLDGAQPAANSDGSGLHKTKCCYLKLSYQSFLKSSRYPVTLNTDLNATEIGNVIFS